MQRHLTSIRLPTLRDGALAALMAIVPLVLAVIVTRLVRGAALSRYTPSVWNDQLGYWTRISSFRVVGFDTGYYAPDETLARIHDSRFGVGGPFFIAFYGALTLLLPWGPHAAAFFNAALIGLALAAYVLWVRPDRRQALVLIAVVITAWPVFEYLPTSSQESFNVAVAIVVALCFLRLLTGPPARRRTIIFVGTVLVLAALERFSWALLFVPYAVLAARGRSRRWIIAAVALAILAAIAVLALQGVLAPPGQNAILDRLRLIRHSPWSGIGDVAAIGGKNFLALVQPTTVGPSEILDQADRTGWSRAATLAQSYAILAVAVVSGVQVARAALAHRRIDSVSALNLFNLVAMTAACVFLYLPLGYYRLLGIHLLLTTLLLIASRRLALATLVIAVNIAVLPGFLDLYRGWKPNMEIPQATLVAQRDSVGRAIKYVNSAPSPWCNTILIHLRVYDSRVLAIPPGFGVSYYLGTLRPPVKSRWVLVDEPPDPAYVQAIDLPSLRPYAQTALGTIYQNPRSPCFKKGG
jgi:hypothetical protein